MRFIFYYCALNIRRDLIQFSFFSNTTRVFALMFPLFIIFSISFYKHSNFNKRIESVGWKADSRALESPFGTWNFPNFVKTSPLPLATHGFPTVSFNLAWLETCQSCYAAIFSSILPYKKAEKPQFSLHLPGEDVRKCEHKEFVFIITKAPSIKKKIFYSFIESKMLPWNDTPFTVPTHLGKLIDVRNLI